MIPHDVGASSDPAVAPAGRWRLLLGPRRMSRAKTVAPVAKTTVDGTPREWELAKALYAAEMLLNRALIAVDEMLPLARSRAHQNDLLDIQNVLTGKATKT